MPCPLARQDRKDLQDVPATKETLVLRSSEATYRKDMHVEEDTGLYHSQDLGSRTALQASAGTAAMEAVSEAAATAASEAAAAAAAMDRSGIRWTMAPTGTLHGQGDR